MTGIQVLSTVEVVIQLLSHFYPRIVKTTTTKYYTLLLTDRYLVSAAPQPVIEALEVCQQHSSQTEAR